jgi:hypothetical protein
MAPIIQTTWRDSLTIDMLLCAVSYLIVALPSLEVPEGLMNHPVFIFGRLEDVLGTEQLL